MVFLTSDSKYIIIYSILREIVPPNIPRCKAEKLLYRPTTGRKSYVIALQQGGKLLYRPTPGRKSNFIILLLKLHLICLLCIDRENTWFTFSNGSFSILLMLKT